MGNQVSQLFGSAEKKEQVIAPPPVQINQVEEKIAKKVNAQIITNHLNENAQLFRNKQLKYEAKINKLKLKAKQFLQNGRQKQAKKILEEAAHIKKQLQRVQVRRKLIEGQNEQVQTHSLNQEVIDAIEAAHELTKQDLNSKLQEHIITARQNKIIQDQINENMKQLVQNSEDQEEADELFKQLEQEIDKDNKRKIPNKNVIVNTKNTALNKKEKQESQVDKMLAEL